MGGTGSGNYGGRPTVEAALKLDLHHLIRNGSFRLGATVTGSLAWTNTDTGEQRASIGYKAHMGEEIGWVRLCYATANQWTGQTTQHDYTVELASTPRPLEAAAGGGSAHGVAISCPSSTCQPVAGSSPPARPIALPTAASGKARMTAPSAKRSSAATVLEQMAASAIPSTSPRGCAGPPLTARWSRSRPQRPSAMPVSSGSSSSLPTSDDERAFTSIHAVIGSDVRATSTGFLLDCHSNGAESLPNTLKRHRIRFHIGVIGNCRRGLSSHACVRLLKSDS